MTSFIKYFIWLSFICLISSCSKTQRLVQQNYQAKIVDPCANEICILSWNTFLFDAFTTDIFDFGPDCEGLECEHRALLVCSIINDQMESPDIVTLQEVFEKDACLILIECMESKGYAFNSGCNEGSGLLSFSKFPMISNSSSFDDLAFSDNPCHGTDCFKEKGLVHSEINMNGCNCSIHVINTHTDAGDKIEDIGARNEQMKLLNSYINQLNLQECETVFLAGDFNFDLRNMHPLEYGFDQLNAKTLLELSKLPTPKPTHNSGQLLDYIAILNDDLTAVSNLEYITQAGLIQYPDRCKLLLDLNYFIENDIEPQASHIGLSWNDYNSVPDKYLYHLIEKCASLSTEIPSDHKLVQACMTFICDQSCTDNNP